MSPNSRAASIRAHLLAIVLAGAVPLVLAVAFDIAQRRQEAVSKTKVELQTQVNAMVRNTGAMIGKSRAVLENLAARPGVQKMDPKHCDPALGAMHSMLPEYTAIIQVDLAGQVLCSSLPVSPDRVVNVSERAWFKEALRDQRFAIGMPVAGAVSGKTVAVISQPVRAASGTLLGFVGLSLDLKKFDPNIADETLPEGTRYGFFADNGILIWRNLDPEKVIGLRPDADAARQIVERRDGTVESVGIDGVRRLFAVKLMPEVGWIAWIGVPAHLVYETPNRNAVITAAIGSTALALLFWIAVVLARRIARPVQALEHSVKTIAAGATGVRIDPRGPREIVTVAHAFNDMMARLERNATDLRIAATAFEAHEPMMITDANGVIVRINSAAQETTGYSEAEALGQTPRLFKSGRHDPDFYAAMWRSIASEGHWTGEIWDKRKDGREYPALLTITAVRDRAGQVSHYIGVQHDISERKRYEEAVHHMAFHDGLTHLPNRRLLSDRLEQALLATRRSGRHGAVVFLDLDNFKPLNDQYGHEFGDLLLIEAAARLRTCVREVDTVARLGGDEFVLVLNDLDEKADAALSEALTVAQKVKDALSVPYELTGAHDAEAPSSVTHRCTASLGLCLFDAFSEHPADILKHADAAMYDAKKAGRDQMRCWQGP